MQRQRRTLGDIDAALSSDPPEYFIASVHLRYAIEALRRIGNTQDLVEALHVQLLDYQQRSVGNMSRIEFELPAFTAEAEQTQQRVTGKSLSDALTSLANVCDSPSVAQLEELANVSIQHGVFRSLASTFLVSEKGKVIAERSANASATGAAADDQRRIEMFEQAHLLQDLHALAFIDPAREKIVEEHQVQIDDVRAFLANSSFIPRDRVKLFARGLLAGLQGDLVVATHLLVPQIENSLHHVLVTHGQRVSGWDKYGIQEEMDLNELLDVHRDVLQGIFGVDTVFDLRALLVERFGTNLRNRLAHGLLADEDVESARAMYMWWLTLRLCVVTNSPS